MKDRRMDYRHIPFSAFLIESAPAPGSFPVFVPLFSKFCYSDNIHFMSKIKSAAVFCASSKPHDAIYSQAASQLGKRLAQENITLVYGGGARGIMADTAEACFKAGGHVIGVLPEVFNRPEVRLKEIQSELHIVKTMHERKAKMYSLSDAFIVLPGGIGTLEEFFEIFTWKQIGFHRKNVALYNVNGFYTPLVSFMEKIVEEGLMSSEVMSSLIVASSLDELMEKISQDEIDLPGKIKD